MAAKRGKIKSKFYIYFAVRGTNLKPEQVTKALKRRPTDTYLKGEQIFKSKLFTKDACWKFRIDAKKWIEDFDYEVLVNRLIDKMGGTKNMKKAAKFGELEINCSISMISTRDVSLELSPKTIKKIADIGCSMWIDYY